MTVTVIIPTYKPDEKFRKLMRMLQIQRYPIEKVIIINTEKKYWQDSFVEGMENVRVYHIARNEFDHGKTRAAGAEMADTDILVYFTQDAVPEDEYVIENLVHPFTDSETGAVYGRQMPDKDCKIIEKYTRKFNYPEQSIRKTKADLPQMGIKTFFCSNVCAAYRKSIYEKMGGFISRTIFNEDMIMAGTMIKAGYAVQYAAGARVIHSHNYGYIQQFKRNFDLAVSQADHPEIFAEVRSENEGIRLVKNTASYLVKIHKPWLVPDLVISSGFKFLGYKAGKRYKNIPMWLIKKISMNPLYWEMKE